MSSSYSSPYFGRRGQPTQADHLYESLLETQARYNFGPQPEPWTVAVQRVISALAVKDVASNLSDGEGRNSVIERAERTITRFIEDWDDDYPPPRWWHGPWPGPLDQRELIISELVLVAHNLQEGTFRTAILEVATRVLEASSQSVSRKQVAPQ